MIMSMVEWHLNSGGGWIEKTHRNRRSKPKTPGREFQKTPVGAGGVWKKTQKQRQRERSREGGKNHRKSTELDQGALT